MVAGQVQAFERTMLSLRELASSSGEVATMQNPFAFMVRGSPSTPRKPAPCNSDKLTRRAVRQEQYGSLVEQMDALFASASVRTIRSGIGPGLPEYAVGLAADWSAAQLAEAIDIRAVGGEPEAEPEGSASPGATAADASRRPRTVSESRNLAIARQVERTPSHAHELNLLKSPAAACGTVASSRGPVERAGPSETRPPVPRRCA